MDSITIYRVQDDTGPDEQFPITRDDGTGNYVPVNITGYTIKLIIKSNKTSTITNLAHQTCTIVDGPNGICKYAFQSGDLPDAGGDYTCDLRITDAGGKQETYYGHITIRTRAKVA